MKVKFSIFLSGGGGVPVIYHLEEVASPFPSAYNAHVCFRTYMVSIVRTWCIVRIMYIF